MSSGGVLFILDAARGAACQPRATVASTRPRRWLPLTGCAAARPRARCRRRCLWPTVGLGCLPIVPKPGLLATSDSASPLPTQAQHHGERKTKSCARRYGLRAVDGWRCRALWRCLSVSLLAGSVAGSHAGRARRERCAPCPLSVGIYVACLASVSVWYSPRTRLARGWVARGRVDNPVGAALLYHSTSASECGSP